MTSSKRVAHEQQPATTGGFFTEIARLALIAIVYFIAVRVGLLFTVQPEGVSSIWPPSGIALAALLLSKRRKWAPILLIIFVTNTVGNVTGGNSLPVSLGFALANIIEPTAGAWMLVHFFGPKITFARLAEVLALCGVAVLSNGLTALFGAAVPTLAFGAPFFNIWFVWWISDGLGIILVTPIIVTWATSPNVLQALPLRRLVEGAVLLAMMLALTTSIFIFFTTLEHPFLHLYMVFPLLIWAALRFSPRGTATMILVFAVIVLWNTVHGNSVFGFVGALNKSVLLVQILIFVATLSGLILAAIVTEHKQAEEALKESRRSWQSIVKNAVVGIYKVTEAGKFILINPRFTDMLGFRSPDDFMASVHNISELYINPEDRPPILREMNTKGFVDGAEVRFRRKDGQTIWIRISARVIKDVSGETVYEGFMVDVTDVKRAQKALQESELWVRNIFASLNESVFVITPEQIFSDMNEAASGMFGYTREELLNRSSDIAHVDHEHYLEFGRKLEQGINKEGVANFQFRMRRKNGDIFPSEHTITPMIDEMGKTIGMVSVVRDLSDQKKMEEDKQRLEAQLQQSHKMESIGTLAGGIAHDFNNILSPIMIHSEMTKMALPPDSPVQHNLSEIFKAGERARDMVKQILTFSRKEEGKRAVIKTTPILKEVLKMLRSSIPTTIGIQQNLEAESDTIFADPTQIHQIMLNLGTNAHHAMRKKGGTLKVSLVQEDLDSEAAAHHPDLNPGSYLKLTVSDTGSGIDDETMPNIFEPYFTTKEVGEGTGMGLALIHGIVKSYGGDITVESDPGKGTTFNVYLPRAEADVLPAEAPSVQIPRGTEKILLVDDETAMVNAIQAMLLILGYKVTARTSSIEALAAFRNDPQEFDLVITDMTMPNMTGKDLAKELMSIRADIPIILCTGFSEQIDEKKAKKMGIKAYLMKPVVMADMAKIIKEVLDI